MTLVDHETRESIINPYIRISHPISKKWVSLNTLTFGQMGQDELIHHFDSKRLSSLCEDTCYEVTAVVGEYNFPHLNTVSLIKAPRSQTLLGFLEKDVVKKYFPNSFRALDEGN